MDADPDPTLSALVVLRPASGRELTGESEITADTLADFLPAPEDAALVRSVFERGGLTTGPLVGIAFPVTGPRSSFERVFGTSVEPAPDGGYQSGSPATGDPRELPLSALPAEASARIAAVTFEPPAQTFLAHY